MDPDARDCALDAASQDVRPELRPDLRGVDALASRLCLARVRGAEARFRELVDGLAAGLRRHVDFVADTLVARVDVLNQCTARVGRRVGRLHADVRRMFTRIERNVRGLETRVADLERRHATVTRAGCRRARGVARRRH